MRERMGVDIQTDASVISSSLRDPAAFAAIFDRHAPTLLGYLGRRVGRNDAEDLLGDLFRIAFESRGRYDLSRPSSLPWLYGIAANLVMKRHRSSGRYRDAIDRLSLVRQDDPGVPFDEQVVEDAANDDLLAHVHAAMRQLAPADREVLVLFAWQNLSYADIAEALDLPVGTIRSRLNRVRTAIRELKPTSGQVPDISTSRAQEGPVR